VSVTGLRNGNGQVLACLTANPKAFPDCRDDPAARKLKVAANKAGVVLDFGAVPAGTWAVSLIHDENGNGRMDKMGMIPREGYGFSRDAPVMMGPPRFASAAFTVGTGPVRQTLKVRYIF
jgi:uncharacterized protein (DUF2141 family)